MDWIEIAIIIFITAGIVGIVGVASQIYLALMEGCAARAMAAKCNLLTITGPQPSSQFLTLAANGVPIHMQAIPVGGYAIVNIENGDIEYSFPRDTNHSMETNFSLDELEEAQEFINGGGKLH